MEGLKEIETDGYLSGAGRDGPSPLTSCARFSPARRIHHKPFDLA
jgi:hypothetical protein